MESYDFNWLNNDEDIMDSLIAIASLPDEPMNEAPLPMTNNVGTDIINYLLEGTQPNHCNSSIVLNQPHNQGKSDSKLREDELNIVLETTTDNPSLPFNIVQGKDNFVTFTPSSAAPKQRPTAKKQAKSKTKFKEPIFVTESPQSFSQKNKKSANNNSASHSSGEDLSDTELNDTLPSGNLKQMTSKERRQLRNKISARNFRVRRKEYITQLEEKVDEYEKTIEQLRKENAQLRQSNQDLVNQINHPITPPSSSPSSIESFNATSSSSEGHHSPEAPPSMFQLQFNDLYDVSLFDQQPQQHNQQPMGANLFYLNHAVMPDLNISEILREKGESITAKQFDQEFTRELFAENPLLAPALMSIVLRHTMSLEYVQSLAEELKLDIVARSKTKDSTNDFDDDAFTVKGDEFDDLKASMKRLEIEDSPEDKDRAERHAEYVADLLQNHFPYYTYQRALGKSHTEVVEAAIKCYEDPNTPCKQRQARKLEKKRAKEAKKAEKSGCSKIQTLQTYCRVAGVLLRNPQRMTRLRNVLKDKINFNDNESLANIEQNFKKLTNPPPNHRLVSSSH